MTQLKTGSFHELQTFYLSKWKSTKNSLHHVWTKTICPINRETSGGSTRKFMYSCDVFRLQPVQASRFFVFIQEREIYITNPVNLQLKITVVGHEKYT